MTETSGLHRPEPDDDHETADPTTDRTRQIARIALGGALLLAGTGHLTAQREEFRAQVPSWFPADPDVVVVVSGVVELVLVGAVR